MRFFGMWRVLIVSRLRRHNAALITLRTSAIYGYPGYFMLFANVFTDPLIAPRAGIRRVGCLCWIIRPLYGGFEFGGVSVKFIMVFGVKLFLFNSFDAL